ncbi:hypothetical protein [Methylomonas albis]|nr:hypothetical protein [Methylomonas albis]
MCEPAKTDGTAEAATDDYRFVIKDRISHLHLLKKDFLLFLDHCPASKKLKKIGVAKLSVSLKTCTEQCLATSCADAVSAV